MRAGRVGTGGHGPSRPAAALALLPPSPPTPRLSAGVSPPAPRRRLTQLELLAPPAGAPPDPAPENSPRVDHRAVGWPAGPGGARNKPAGQRGRREGPRPAEPGEGATVVAGTGQAGTHHLSSPWLCRRTEYPKSVPLSPWKSSGCWVSRL